MNTLRLHRRRGTQYQFEPLKLDEKTNVNDLGHILPVKKGDRMVPIPMQDEQLHEELIAEYNYRRRVWGARVSRRTRPRAPLWCAVFCWGHVDVIPRHDLLHSLANRSRQRSLGWPDLEEGTDVEISRMSSSVSHLDSFNSSFVAGQYSNEHNLSNNRKITTLFA